MAKVRGAPVTYYVEGETGDMNNNVGARIVDTHGDGTFRIVTDNTDGTVGSVIDAVNVVALTHSNPPSGAFAKCLF